MKTLLLVALCLALGVGVMWFAVGSSGGARPSTNAPGAPAWLPERPRLPLQREAPLSDPGPPARQSMDAGLPAPVRRFVEGVVIGEGAPLPGADLKLSCDAGPLAEGTSDEHGRFRLEFTPPATPVSMSVRARGFVPVERTLGVKPLSGTELVGNLRLVRGVKLHGRVVDVAGRGIADAEVTVKPRSSGSDIVSAQARSGPDGAFDLSDAPPGKVTISVRARGFGECTVQGESGSGEEVLISLEPGAELRLRIHAPDGQPIQGAEVSIQSADPRAPARTAKSDEAGSVAIDGLSASTWNVRVTHPEYRPTGQSQVQANGIEVPILCQPWPSIRGVVRSPDGSAPPEGTQVIAQPSSAPGDRVGLIVGGQPVSSDGSFRIAGLRPGEWVVRATAPGFSPVASAPVRLGVEGEGWAGTLNLVAGARLRVQILLEGRALEGAEAELQTSRPTPALLWSLQDARGSVRQNRVPSASDGILEITGVPPGEAWVVVFADRCPPTLGGPFPIAAGETVGPVRIELERGARVSGRVVRGTGEAVVRSQVRLTDRGSKLGFPLIMVTDEEGRYRSSWVPAGTYSLEAFAPTDPTQTSSPLEVRLESGEDHEQDLSL